MSQYERNHAKIYSYLCLYIKNIIILFIIFIINKNNFVLFIKRLKMKVEIYTDTLYRHSYENYYLLYEYWKAFLGTPFTNMDL